MRWLVSQQQPQTAASELITYYLFWWKYLLILVKVSVKVVCHSTSVTACSRRTTSMLLILVEVSVKVVCQSMTVTACSCRTTSMLLIMVEVSVKTGLSVYDSHSLQSQNYLHATYYGVSICEMYLSVHNIDRQTTA